MAYTGRSRKALLVANSLSNFQAERFRSLSCVNDRKITNPESTKKRSTPDQYCDNVLKTKDGMTSLFSTTKWPLSTSKQAMPLSPSNAGICSLLDNLKPNGIPRTSSRSNSWMDVCSKLFDLHLESEFFAHRAWQINSPRLGKV